MLRVMMGNSEVLPYLYHFDSYRRCEQMLNWLIKNQLTGKEFLAWVKFHFNVSMLEVGRFILAQIDHEKGHRPVLLGRDILGYEGHQ